LTAIGRKAFSSPEAAVLKANPWLAAGAEDFARQFALPNNLPPTPIAGARREASLQRLRAGSAAWNEWAAAMLESARRLADAPLRRMWSYLAATDLAGFSSDPPLRDLAGLLFPGRLDLSAAIFSKTAWFSGSACHGEVSFQNAEFVQGAYFERAVFDGPVCFDDASFGKAAEFRQSRFHGPASFRAVQFDKDAWFRGAEFKGALDMSRASFGGEAGLGDIRYGAGADFSHVKFADNAGFEQAVFDGVARFDDARFARNARFEEARFGQEPSFDRTRFSGRAIFDGISVPEGGSPARQALADLVRRLG
jgi:hypothetical protein